MELQHQSLRFLVELNRMDCGSITRIAHIGRRGQGLKFAGTTMFVRRRLARQAQVLLAQVERAMAARTALQPA